MPKARGLTPKQERFVTEYLVDLNATQAAIRAGYSAKTADDIGRQLLRNNRVAAAVRRAKDTRAERVEVTQEEILRRLLDIATVDVNEIVEYRREPCHECWEIEPEEQRPADINPECELCRGDGVGRPFFKDSRKLSPAARALYAGVKQTKEGMEVLMASRDKALALLAQHVGIAGKLELTGKGGVPLVPPVALNLTPEQLTAAVRAALEKV